MTSSKLYFSTLFLTLIVLAGCKSKKKQDDLIVVPAQESYQKGLELLNIGKNKQAAEEFSKIFFQHPGNQITPYAEIMQAYSLYLASQYDEAVDVLDNFIMLHPMHSDVAYVYYLRALSYYMQISQVELDQSRTVLAKDSFEELIQRFPHTKYASDGKLKIDLINEHLAGKEMEIGRYYLNAKNPIAAIRRFKEVANNYQTTSHIQEALYRLTLCYTQLGILNEARTNASILGNNYPSSKWYKYAYELIEQHGGVQK